MNGSILTEAEDSDQKRRRLAILQQGVAATLSLHHSSPHAHTNLHNKDQCSNTGRSLPLYPPHHIRMHGALLCIRIPSSLNNTVFQSVCPRKGFRALAAVCFVSVFLYNHNVPINAHLKVIANANGLDVQLRGHVRRQ